MWVPPADGWRCRWVDEHTPSGVATLCDDGILPFGLSPSGGRLCQNRITGDPRTVPTRSTWPDLVRYFLLPAGRSSVHLGTRAAATSRSRRPAGCRDTSGHSMANHDTDM
ncbi:hypothetical protein FGD71_044205 [Streptomyces sporangiiformans]|uniref:Uncharacterized protein n=1 Tax=Streptomyces sporangiiformans TaxID=2315329 RepID=A0A505CWK0_9ACTN|nr:hypothetical protein FGD71_044205 [Streptomyces sporangiiformans]